MNKFITGIVLIIIAILIVIFYGKTDIYYAVIAVCLVAGISLVIVGGVELLPDKSKKKEDSE